METTKIRKVLIAIDYDKSAKIVAESGHTIAKAMKADSILLHVIYEHPAYYSENPNIYELHMDFIENMKERTLKFLEEIKRLLDDGSVQTVLKEGEIASTILETAQEMEADIIVLGSHSRKWLENIFLGNDAIAVLKKTTIPLFIIPIKSENT
ncbi:universal stress protein [Bacteroides sedimenti]|uniref:Universal stress protein n=1 Tax=Bacteroides sedimenti TaxID=2136147 RepID=A0ABN6Z6X3_9BACE